MCAGKVPTALTRKGGAGPSDHKALTLGEHTAMVPMLNHASQNSPYSAVPDASGAQALIFREGLQVGQVQLPGIPTLLRPEHRRRHALLENRHPAQQGCAGHDRSTALHSQ